MAGNGKKDTATVAPEETDEKGQAFREALHRVIERVGFPHETDVKNAKDAVDNYLGYEVPAAPYTGPMYDQNTGEYLGPDDDPRAEAASDDVAPALA